ncbi:MAG: hypothetical protein ABIP68_00880 [Ferruginibacter sp.]
MENNKANEDKYDENVTPTERELIDESQRQSDIPDDVRLERAELDNTDEDGTPLNEKSMADDVSGSDLDVPGSGLDDADEAIGSEDEENNSYSQADTD